MTKNKRIAVIGAGPAGAIATDALLKEQAFSKIRVFERQSRAGGTWVYDPDLSRGIPSIRALLDKRADLPPTLPSIFPCETVKSDSNSQQLRFSDTAAYKHLHSNLPPNIMCFTQEPLPEVVSERMLAVYGPTAPFRHREIMRQWVQDILNRGNIERFVEYNTTVELAEKLGEEWVLTLRQETPGDGPNSWWQESFDSLVVATGHYYLPHIPDIPGLAEYSEKYPGRIIHSKHYPAVETFRGKRVVVVGGSVSAFDALHDIRLVSQTPVISSLRKPNGLFGMSPFTHPDISNQTEISAFDPETGRLTFIDDSWIDDVDFVLLATGFQFSFPFLPSVKPVNGRLPGLYQHIFQISDPTLAFLGMITGGFGIRIFEWQAVAAARVLAGHATLPSKDEMEQWEIARIEEVGDNPAFWTLMPDFEKHFEALRAIAGDPSSISARSLPEYDPKWAESFWDLIRSRKERWEREAARQSKARN